MKGPVKVLMVAINGYGHYYLQTLLKEIDCEKAVLAGVVDPEPSGSPYYEAFKEFGIPVFDRMEDFYQSGATADLTVISSPPHFHIPQSILALDHGSNVLCEKPVSAQVKDAQSLIEIRDRAGKFVMIGYQWSYSDGIQHLKNDILDGKFGKPLRMRSLCLWPRTFAYFARNSWAYRKYDNEGNMVMDNIFQNATSHFIHNMFFLMGKTMESSDEPVDVKARISKAYPVETFDTGAFIGEGRSGVEYLFIGSHVAEKTVDPCFRIDFENGFAELRSGADQIVAGISGQSEFHYPAPDSDHQFKKLFMAVDNVIRPGKLICPPEAALSQTKLAEMVDRLCGEAPKIRQDRIMKTPERLFVRDLDDQLISAYNSFKMPVW